MVSLRPFQKEDYSLVYKITEAAMRPYVEETFGPWVEEDQRQRSAQINAGACHHIIQLEDVDIGVLVVERSESHIQLDRLYLLPRVQNKGIGTSLLRELQAEAERKNLPLRLRVLRCNPARLWYQREGFTIIDATPERWFMEYNG